MIDERMTELMQREIDGVVSSEESAELHRHLDAHPEALGYYEELLEVDCALSAGGGAEPPADLKDAIVAAARESTGPTPRGRHGAAARTAVRATFRRWLPTKPAPAFAIGLLVGFGLCAATLIALLGDSSGLNSEWVDPMERPYGTMMLPGGSSDDDTLQDDGGAGSPTGTEATASDSALVNVVVPQDE